MTMCGKTTTSRKGNNGNVMEDSIKLSSVMAFAYQKDLSTDRGDRPSFKTKNSLE
jgi:hypothetical protein